jgi:hypothetical protein
LAALLIAAVIWFLRDRARKQNDERVRQLDEAAELLSQHAECVEMFLSAAAAPRELKALLIEFSDAMADKAVVEKMAAWAASRPFKAPVESEDADALLAILTQLRDSEPALCDQFTLAIATAAMGASLRWPKTAILFDRIFSRLVTIPEREVVIAVTATGFRSSLPFSLRPTVAAMA